MRTLQQLVNTTWRRFRHRGEHECAPAALVRSKRARDGSYWEQVYHVQCLSKVRNVTIRFKESRRGKRDAVPSWTRPVWVNCDCPAFQYYAEWVLAKSKASDILFSNGKPPYIRNPRFEEILCKHVIAASLLVPRSARK